MGRQNQHPICRCHKGTRLSIHIFHGLHFAGPFWSFYFIKLLLLFFKCKIVYSTYHQCVQSSPTLPNKLKGVRHQIVKMVWSQTTQSTGYHENILALCSIDN